jgi:hypothetical protein
MVACRSFCFQERMRLKISRWWQLSLMVLLLSGPGPTFGQQAHGLAVQVLAQSPAETKTDLQVICLFRSSPGNTLHGSLVETNEKLHGVLDQIRKSNLFGGELGETILLTPPDGTLGAKKLLMIGLGDSETFMPDRMYLVGKIAWREANRLAVAHPFFAPTVIDGGVTKYTTGEGAEQVVRGFRDAAESEAMLPAGPVAVVDFTYLAGAKHAADTQGAIDRALGKSAASPQ